LIQVSEVRYLDGYLKLTREDVVQLIDLQLGLGEGRLEVDLREEVEKLGN